MAFTVLADFHRHALRKVAFGDGSDNARRFANRVRQAINQRVYRINPLRPSAAHVTHGKTFLDAAFFADHPAHTAQLGSGTRHQLRDVIERIGHFACDAGPGQGQTRREISLFDGHQCGQNLSSIQMVGFFSVRG